MKDVKHLFQPVPVWVIVAVVVSALLACIVIYGNVFTLIKAVNELPITTESQAVEVETYNPQETTDGFNLQPAQ